MKTSAGLLLYKILDKDIQIFLVHPGGPFWKGKDKGCWGIPKGEVNMGEKLLDAAIRETLEETGIDLSKRLKKEFKSLGKVKQKSGKIVYAWAIESDWSGLLNCQSFCKVEWPIKSSIMIKISEVDKASFFGLKVAKKKMNEIQWEFVQRLIKIWNSSKIPVD